jgi:hypothetical protein
MCFSATPSFTASGLLGLISIISYKQVQHRKQLLFASIPLLFSIQQAAEGIVWLSFTHAIWEPWRLHATYLFLFFAFILWPVLIPVSLYYLERPYASKWLSRLGMIGITVSLYLTTGLIQYGPVTQMFDCHILYTVPMANHNVYITSFLYVCATIAPFFFTHISYMRLFGCLFALSYLISYLFYYRVLISVWCFFAALLSISVAIMLHYQNKHNQL